MQAVSTITSKGQVTIPILLRRKLRLRPGDKLVFDAEGSVLKASKKLDVERMRSTLGRGKNVLKGKSVKQWMDWLRGSSDYSW